MALSGWWRAALGALLLLAAVAASGSPPIGDKQSSTTSRIAPDPLNRPRLYLDRERLAFLREHLGADPYRVFWQNVLDRIGNYDRRPMPEDLSRLDNSNIREFGDRLPYLALARLVTGDLRYLTAARALLERFTAMQDWTGNNDLGAAHLLFGMAVAYDWLYDDLNQEERQRYRQRTATQAQKFYEQLTGQTMWWATTWLQNHNYTNVMAMAIAGVALLGEVESARDWLEVAAQDFDKVQQLLSPDGASHEGVGYWGYGIESLLKYYLGTARINGLDKLRNSEYFRHALAYRLHMSLPGYCENADYADSPRYDWHGPGFILREYAHLYRDGLGNWLARKIEAARDPKAYWLARPKYSWLDLVVYDESVPGRTPLDVLTSAGFDSLGIYVIRDAWENGRFWSLYKAGPSQGEHAYAQNYYAGSHIHPDSGHYSIWWQGAWRVQDDGRIRIKRTHNHNVLLFDGAGQLGEGSSSFRKGQLRARRVASRIVYRDIKPDYQYVVAEIAGVYAPQSGVRSWERTYVALAQGIVVVRDEVRTGRPVRVESLIHLSARPRSMPDGSQCLDRASGYMLRPVLPTGWNVGISAYNIPAEEQQNQGATVSGFLVKEQGTVDRSVSIMNIYAPGQSGCQGGALAAGTVDGKGVTVRGSDNRRYRIDFSNRSVSPVS